MIDDDEFFGDAVKEMRRSMLTVAGVVIGFWLIVLAVAVFLLIHFFG